MSFSDIMIGVLVDKSPLGFALEDIIRDDKMQLLRIEVVSYEYRTRRNIDNHVYEQTKQTQAKIDEQEPT